MPTTGNLFGDLLRISGGDLSPLSERLQQFRFYADTVPASVRIPSQQSRDEWAPPRDDPKPVARAP